MGFAWEHFGVVAEGLVTRLLGCFLKWAMSKTLYIAFFIVIYRGISKRFQVIHASYLGLNFAADSVSSPRATTPLRPAGRARRIVVSRQRQPFRLGGTHHVGFVSRHPFGSGDVLFYGAAANETDAKRPRT